MDRGQSAKLTAAFLRAMEIQRQQGQGQGQAGQAYAMDPSSLPAHPPCPHVPAVASAAFSSIGPAPAAESMAPPPAYDEAASISAATFFAQRNKHGAAASSSASASVSASGLSGARRVGGLQLVHVHPAPTVAAAAETDSQSDFAFEPPQKQKQAPSQAHAKGTGKEVATAVPRDRTLAPTVARLPTETEGTTDAEAAAAVTPLFCEDCGARRPADAGRFCSHCGAKQR